MGIRQPKDRARRATVHRIAWVDFTGARAAGLGESEAALACTCGELMRSGAWEAHRGPTAREASQALVKIAYRARHRAPEVDHAST
jgi:hypothetical protein